MRGHWLKSIGTLYDIITQTCNIPICYFSPKQHDLLKTTDLQLIKKKLTHLQRTIFRPAKAKYIKNTTLMQIHLFLLYWTHWIPIHSIFCYNSAWIIFSLPLFHTIVYTKGTTVAVDVHMHNTLIYEPVSHSVTCKHVKNFQIKFSRNTQNWQCWHFCIAFIFEHEMDIVISHLNFNSKLLDKCKFALKLIPVITISNLFSLEVAQKCQHWQLCVLWGAEDLGKCSGFLMIIRLPVS